MTIITYENEQAWLAGRRDSLGTSEWSDVLGLDPDGGYRSPYTVWAEKTGRLVSSESTIAMRRGHALEPLIADEYTRETGHEVDDWGDFTVVRHPDHEFLTCTPDRIRTADACPVELKSTDRFDFRALYRDGKAPLSHTVQLQGQMTILGRDCGDIAALCGGRLHVVQDNLDVDSMDKIIPALTRWWEDHIINDIPPQPDASHSTLETIKVLHPKDNGETLFAPHLEQLIADWLDKKKQAKALDTDIKEIEARIKHTMQDYTYLDAGPFLLSYRHQTRTGKFQVERTDDNKAALEAAGISFAAPFSEFRVLRTEKKKGQG